MRDRVLVDSNVLIYAHDLDAGDKHLRAAEVVRGLWENRNGASTLLSEDLSAGQVIGGVAVDNPFAD